VRSIKSDTNESNLLNELCFTVPVLHSYHYLALHFIYVVPFSCFVVPAYSNIIGIPQKDEMQIFTV
jgi:hypothetical protein